MEADDSEVRRSKRTRRAVKAPDEAAGPSEQGGATQEDEEQVPTMPAKLQEATNVIAMMHQTSPPILVRGQGQPPKPNVIACAIAMWRGACGPLTGSDAELLAMHRVAPRTEVRATWVHRVAQIAKHCNLASHRVLRNAFAAWLESPDPTAFALDERIRAAATSDTAAAPERHDLAMQAAWYEGVTGESLGDVDPAEQWARCAAASRRFDEHRAADAYGDPELITRSDGTRVYRLSSAVGPHAKRCAERPVFEGVFPVPSAAETSEAVQRTLEHVERRMYRGA